MKDKTGDKTGIREYIRRTYGDIAGSGSGCGCGCTPAAPAAGPWASEDESKGKHAAGATAADIARKIGYGEEELMAVPEGANLGLGCGNPTALAGLRQGETVLDLGSGTGFDCFLATERVGSEGRVIGVDMTAEMIERARSGAAEAGTANVEFRLGEIENLPVADESVDVIISNCVLNLSTDKPQTFSEMLRVLKPGGRLAISDIALLRELPAAIRDSLEGYAGCVSGALLEEDYLELVRDAGFIDVRLSRHPVSLCAEDFSGDPLAAAFLGGIAHGENATDFIASVNVEAIKPAG